MFDNIVYGDQTRKISKAEVEEAARLANMHEFVMSLKDVSYKTIASFYISKLHYILLCSD